MNAKIKTQQATREEAIAATSDRTLAAFPMYDEIEYNKVRDYNTTDPLANPFRMDWAFWVESCICMATAMEERGAHVVMVPLEAEHVIEYARTNKVRVTEAGAAVAVAMIRAREGIDQYLDREPVIVKVS
jgi:hypothetical protein